MEGYAAEEGPEGEANPRKGPCGADRQWAAVGLCESVLGLERQGSGRADLRACLSGNLEKAKKEFFGICAEHEAYLTCLIEIEDD